MHRVHKHTRACTRARTRTHTGPRRSTISCTSRTRTSAQNLRRSTRSSRRCSNVQHPLSTACSLSRCCMHLATRSVVCTTQHGTHRTQQAARKCARHDASPHMAHLVRRGIPRGSRSFSPRPAGSFLRTVAVLHGGRQGAIADKVYLLVSGACDLEKSVVFARKRVGADGAQTTERHSRVVPVSTLRVCPACRTANKQTNEQATNPRPQAESPLAGGAVPAPSLRAQCAERGTLGGMYSVWPHGRAGLFGRTY